MVGTVVGELGGIDIVVNNAGVTRHGELLDITEETWDLMQRVNAKGTFASIAMAFPICSAATNRDKHMSESRRNAD